MKSCRRRIGPVVPPGRRDARAVERRTVESRQESRRFGGIPDLRLKRRRMSELIEPMVEEAAPPASSATGAGRERIDGPRGS